MKSSREGISWSRRAIAAGLIGTGVMASVVANKAIDSLPFHHIPRIPKAVEVKPQTVEGLTKVIALELEKTQKHEGDKKTYGINTSLTKKNKVYLLGKHVGDDVDTGYISTTGSAQGFVDFEGLNETRIAVAPDDSSITITLPHAELENVSASHEEGVVQINHDRNVPCIVDQCHLVNDATLLQLADKKLEDTVGADKEVLQTAEDQTRIFLDGIINGVAIPLLRNQDPVHAPSHINVQIAFDNAAGPASYQPDIQGRR